MDVAKVAAECEEAVRDKGRLSVSLLGDSMTPALFSSMGVVSTSQGVAADRAGAGSRMGAEGGKARGPLMFHVVAAIDYFIGDARSRWLGPVDRDGVAGGVIPAMIPNHSLAQGSEGGAVEFHRVWSALVFLVTGGPA